MNDLQVFMFEKQQVRIVDRNGDPWFVAKDVCDILGIQNARNALQNFPENERNTVDSTYGIHSGPGNPNVNIVNEPGLYRLVFQSRKPEAESFKTWVFTEVLPSIRKKGFYAVPGNDRQEQDEWKNNFPYPFLLLEDAAVKMREMRLAMNKGAISISEWRRVVLGDFGSYKPCKDIIDFANENFTITGNLKDFVRVSDLYDRYQFQCKNGLSRQKFTRQIKKAFPTLVYKQKKINDYPVLVFCGCRLSRSTLKEAVNA